MQCVRRWRKLLELERPITARIIKDYEASDPDPLVISAGEKLQVGENDTTWPAFVRCRNGQGNEGWVPESFIEREGDVAIARIDYSAVELTVTSGDTVILEQEVGGWYWATNEAGQSGWIPVEYIQT